MSFFIYLFALFFLYFFDSIILVLKPQLITNLFFYSKLTEQFLLLYRTKLNQSEANLVRLMLLNQIKR